ncbi:MAG: DNA-binding transcriptional MerR regulator [Pseudophaeobacter arcticus]|jgi:DNA-binding transcriptional MerR regulator
MIIGTIKMSKSADAFRTISEVADWLGVQAHVLRFWESKFTQIKPVKRAGGRRYYRPADMLLLGGIRKLLHKDGLSIKEVQAILRDLGISHVSQMSHDLDSDGPPSDSFLPGALSKTTGGSRNAGSASSPQQTTSPSPVEEEPPEDATRPSGDAANDQRPPGLSNKTSSSSGQADDVLPPLATKGASGTETAPLADETFDTRQSESFPAPDHATVTDAPATAEDGLSELGSEQLPQTDPIPPSPPAEIDLVQPDAATAEPEQMYMELDGPAELAPAAQTLSELGETGAVETTLSDTTPQDTAPSAADPVELMQHSPLTGESQNPAADVAVDSLEAPSQHAFPPQEQADPAYITDATELPQPPAAPSAPAATVLALLAQTSRLPAHIKADVAGCAAELRAILAAG